MKRSRPVAFLCLIVYLCTATGLVQASLLGLFNPVNHIQHGLNQAQISTLSDTATKPLHQAKPIIILDLASLLKNDNLQESTRGKPAFFVITTELVTWPATIPALRSQICSNAPLPLFRSDSLQQFHTLSLQV